MAPIHVFRAAINRRCKRNTELDAFTGGYRAYAAASISGRREGGGVTPRPPNKNTGAKYVSHVWVEYVNLHRDKIRRPLYSPPLSSVPKNKFELTPLSLCIARALSHTWSLFASSLITNDPLKVIAHQSPPPSGSRQYAPEVNSSAENDGVSLYTGLALVFTSDVDRGQTPEDEAEDEDKTPRTRTRPRTKPRGRGRGRGQNHEDEDEAEDNISRPRPRSRTKFRPRGQSGLEDLTSLVFTGNYSETEEHGASDVVARTDASNISTYCTNVGCSLYR